MDVSVSHFNTSSVAQTSTLWILVKGMFNFFKAIHIYMVLLFILKLWFTTNNLALNTVFIIRFKYVSH